MTERAIPLSRAEARRERRRARASHDLRRAMSPARILLRLAGIPVLALSVGLSIYLRSSPWPPSVALADLLARGGCSVAEKVGLAPAYRGQPGYHPQNDPDGDGIACDQNAAQPELAADRPAPQPPATAPAPAPAPTEHRPGGAKFLRP